MWRPATMAKEATQFSPTQGAQGNSDIAHFEEVARVWYKQRELLQAFSNGGCRYFPIKQPFCELQEVLPREECERLRKFKTGMI